MIDEPAFNDKTLQDRESIDFSDIKAPNLQGRKSIDISSRGGKNHAKTMLNVTSSQNLGKKSYKLPKVISP